jgi:hypothetical protein
MYWHCHNAEFWHRCIPFLDNNILPAWYHWRLSRPTQAITPWRWWFCNVAERRDQSGSGWPGLENVTELTRPRT